MHHLAIVTALMLSFIAATFSVFGLMSIFSGAVIAIAIMGGALELAKVVSAVYLHLYWKSLLWFIKLYLVISVIILMFITSIGVFGYLSKAHLEQQIKIETGVGEKIKLISLKISNQKNHIKELDLQMEYLSSPVSKMVELSKRSRDARRALWAFNKQKKSRNLLIKEKETHLTTLSELNTTKIKLNSELAIQESEVGPLKYVANLIYGNANRYQLEKSVRWLIIILVATFDPLAIALLLAASGHYRNVYSTRSIQRILDETDTKNHIKISKGTIMRWR